MTKKAEGLPIWVMSFIALAIVFGLWIGGAYYMWERFDDTSRGAAGDSFGGITALFSGLAFAALIVTLVMQRRELELQREELADTRAVMEGQSKHIERQNFEATFFRMLEQFERLIAEYTGHNSKGREAITRSAPLNPPIAIPVLNTGGRRAIPATNVSEILDWWENKRYPQFEPFLGGYFRVFYNILAFVDRAHISDEEKRIYSGFLRATLSPQELSLIFYNGISTHSREKMKPLIETYGMLKHLPEKFARDEPLVFEAYEPSAFGALPQKSVALPPT